MSASIPSPHEPERDDPPPYKPSPFAGDAHADSHADAEALNPAVTDAVKADIFSPDDCRERVRQAMLDSGFRCVETHKELGGPGKQDGIVYAFSSTPRTKEEGDRCANANNLVRYSGFIDYGTIRRELRRPGFGKLLSDRSSPVELGGPEAEAPGSSNKGEAKDGGVSGEQAQPVQPSIQAMMKARITGMIVETIEEIRGNIPQTRASSLVVTKLQEAELWMSKV